MEKVLTIAGSDSIGGAGIQADLKTIAAHNLYGMSVITAVTAQNTLGVRNISEISVEMVEDQIDAVFEDIRPDAVKIGMVADVKIIEAISKKLKEHQAENIVVDPVMVATSGSKLLKDDAIETLVAELLPLARLITPNLKEAEVLCGFEISSSEDMKKAAVCIYDKIAVPVLVKGGHSADEATDILYDGNGYHLFNSKRIDNDNTHGTGCTLSSAIACNLAEGHSLDTSVKNAKDYITGALKDGLDLGRGSGPLNHMYQSINDR